MGACASIYLSIIQNNRERIIMYTSLNTTQVAQELMRVEAMGRDDDAWECCKALAEYLEQYEEDTGEAIELDPIALRCEFSSYTYAEAEDNWCIDTAGAESVEELRAMILDYLQDNTTVIQVSENLLVILEF